MRLWIKYPGKDVKIETENGDVLSYKFSQIKQIQTEKLNEKMSLWSQIPLLDVIKLKDEPIELAGFISSRTLGKEQWQIQPRALTLCPL